MLPSWHRQVFPSWFPRPAAFTLQSQISLEKKKRKKKKHPISDLQVKMADAFLEILLKNLNSLIQKELGLIWGVDREMKRLLSLLSIIQAVLEDAEEKQVRDKAIQNWLRKLKDAAYEVDDILDDLATETSRSESEGQHSRLINKVHTSFLRPNNILFCRKIGNRMRDVRERLNEIAEERVKFHLREGAAERPAEVTEHRKTGSIVTQSQVYGRDDDKERVADCLVKQVAGCDDVSVYTIVGLGGLGKTTLAQVVFNDERIKRHFELRIWVCVSEDFSVRGILKAIIESATGATCEALDLDPLQRRLQEILIEKRYLLVLDDVWNENQENWDRLKYVLACGSVGASIIATTRIKRVASVMATLPLHHLSGLSEDDCWSLFCERSFGLQEERSNLVALGKEIVKKCTGVPLAVKSLGSMMRYKTRENEWRSVAENELWNLPQDETSILPALRLSYSSLPSNLRQCFAYCAVFPKDSLIEEETLIQLWMANGLIPFTEGLEPEDIGKEMCNELCWRSFFQLVEQNKLQYKEIFKMHDLVHDLAQSIMKDECLITKSKSSDNISKRIFHVTVVTDSEQLYPFPKALYEVESLRTFLLHRSFMNTAGFSCDFSRLRSLRVFGARDARLMNLSSIGCLKHLRYLDLSSTDIQMLPESICSLFNLMTLKLECCLGLKELPEKMKCLKNLRHLNLKTCLSLSQMPPNIGEITCLKTLTLFVVGKKRGCHLIELKELNLEGELHIENLYRVANPMDAKEANLVGKRNLRRLSLSWAFCGGFSPEGNVEEVLEALEPHPDLEHLAIHQYKGVEFPYWMKNRVLNNVVSIKLSDFDQCLELPPLGHLPSLRNLELDTISHVLYIDHNFQGGRMMGGFPSLESLIIKDLPNLQRLLREDGSEILPCLTSLRINNCPNLTLPCLPSLKFLMVLFCNEELLSSISNIRSLTSLTLANNDKLICLPQGMLRNLTSLKSLEIGCFNKLKELSTGLNNNNALESISISYCSQLESFLEQDLEGLNHLKKLSIHECRKFTSLPDGLQHLSSLGSLTLSCYPEVVSLPNGIRHLSSLQSLMMSGKYTKVSCSINPSCCPKLAVLPDALRHVTSLQSLHISGYPDLASLPDWLGDLTSLHSLIVVGCPKLSSLPTSIQRLTNLQKLAISQCPELMRRCEDTGEDWYKIAHISNVSMEPHGPS